jgi:hypothetical protein
MADEERKPFNRRAHLEATIASRLDEVAAYDLEIEVHEESIKLAAGKAGMNAKVLHLADPNGSLKESISEKDNLDRLLQGARHQRGKAAVFLEAAQNVLARDLAKKQ